MFRIYLDIHLSIPQMLSRCLGKVRSYSRFWGLPHGVWVLVEERDTSTNVFGSALKRLKQRVTGSRAADRGGRSGKASLGKKSCAETHIKKEPSM